MYLESYMKSTFSASLCRIEYKLDIDAIYNINKSTQVLWISKKKVKKFLKCTIQNV